MKKRKSKIFKFLAIIFLFIFILIYHTFFSSKKHSIQVNGVNREYLLHLTRSSEKVPLIIALHGYSDNPRLMEFYTGLSRKADKEKFAVVYPYGTNSEKDKKLSWNGGVCCGNAVLTDVDDVSFINSLTDDLIKKYEIDPKRIYLVGFSNGAILAHRIAAETPDKYKAVAVVSGSIGGKVYKALPPYVIPTPKKPISILIMHGLLDKRIPYLGGENANKDGSFISFKESTELWIKSNNCEKNLKIENKIIINESYVDCSIQHRVELYTIKNSGHVWPGSFVELKKNLKGESFPATDIIWNFFKDLR